MIKALLSFFIAVFISLSINVHGQQKYPGLSSSSLYTCNGQQQSCKAFLIFQARSPYDTVRTISSLTFASPEELSRINNEAEYDAVFPTNKEVIIPINCSCSGRYYQANASATVGPDSDSYDRVANELFQGLSTSESLERENRPHRELNLSYGLELKVPLRCACPTKNQTEIGAKFLLTYSVYIGDNIPDIAKRFNVSSNTVFDANELSEINNPTIFAHVPILIPLKTQPLSSQTIIHNEDDESQTPPSFLDLKPKKPKSNRIKPFVVFAIIAGCSVLVLVTVFVVFVHNKKKRSSSNNKLLLPPRHGSKRRLSPEDLRVEIASFEKGLKVFTIEEIRKATESFNSESNRIKGSVYRGVFGEENEATFAVKKIKGDPLKEVNMLKKLNHFNLIKLVGVCTHHGKFYLVFEYMENGSLREWLLCDKNGSDKSWTKRIKIALDVAQGLNYLHSFTEPGYVHKNIKSSNILLNNDLRAKISNFGLSGPANDRTAASHVVGTRGYVAPEYLANGISTTKIDVFAFGVVLLELLSGKKALAVEEGNKQVLLSSRIVEIMDSDSGDDVGDEFDLFVDCGLRENGYDRFREFGLRVAKLSVACLNRDPESRPNMSEVVSSLSKILGDLKRIQS